MTAPFPYLKVWITGALWAKRGEQGILHEAREEERRKTKLYFSPPLVSRFAHVSLRSEMLLSPRLANKAPVMQATPVTP